ncbi:plasmid recombination protein, partial [Elizabethkingia ursingii]|uniref:MobV family relaxase n=1 Tax=Elizabethkingia ursingii TaxID=1756150 RepID=UPI0020139B70
MSYTVLHLEKAKGNDAAMSAHIERTIHPKNADKTREHLNKEFIIYPRDVKNRTAAIQYRIDHAEIKRKIGINQVRAIRIMLSGTHDTMKNIEESRNLDNWCKDNLSWLKETFGEDNLVSAVLGYFGVT